MIGPTSFVGRREYKRGKETNASLLVISALEHYKN
jgi:hypothetical protein